MQQFDPMIGNQDAKDPRFYERGVINYLPPPDDPSPDIGIGDRRFVRISITCKIKSNWSESYVFEEIKSAFERDGWTPSRDTGRLDSLGFDKGLDTMCVDYEDKTSSFSLIGIMDQTHVASLEEELRSNKFSFKVEEISTSVYQISYQTGLGM